MNSHALHSHTLKTEHRQTKKPRKQKQPAKATNSQHQTPKNKPPTKHIQPKKQNID
jgi:hypothetical protein